MVVGFDYHVVILPFRWDESVLSANEIPEREPPLVPWKFPVFVHHFRSVLTRNSRKSLRQQLLVHRIRLSKYMVDGEGALDEVSYFVRLAA